MYNFRPLTVDDIPLIYQRRQEPHVVAGWQKTITLEEAEKKYRDKIEQGRELCFLVCLGEHPFAYMQAHDVSKPDPEGGAYDGRWQKEPAGTRGIDYFIGDPVLRKEGGHGTRMIQEFTYFLFAEYEVYKVTADPRPDNRASNRALEKAGFTFQEDTVLHDGTIARVWVKCSSSEPV